MVKKKSSTTPTDPLAQARAELIALQQDIKDREEKIKNKQASTGKSSVPVQTLCAIETRKAKEQTLKNRIERLQVQEEAVTEDAGRSSSPLSDLPEDKTVDKMLAEVTTPFTSGKRGGLNETKEVEKSIEDKELHETVDKMLNEAATPLAPGNETREVEKSTEDKELVDKTLTATPFISGKGDGLNEMREVEKSIKDKELSEQRNSGNATKDIDNSTPRHDASLLRTDQLLMQFKTSFEKLMFGDFQPTNSTPNSTPKQMEEEKTALSQGALDLGTAWRYLARNKSVNGSRPSSPISVIDCAANKVNLTPSTTGSSVPSITDNAVEKTEAAPISTLEMDKARSVLMPGMETEALTSTLEMDKVTSGPASEVAKNINVPMLDANKATTDHSMPWPMTAVEQTTHVPLLAKGPSVSMNEAVKLSTATSSTPSISDAEKQLRAMASKMGQPLYKLESPDDNGNVNLTYGRLLIASLKTRLIASLNIEHKPSIGDANFIAQDTDAGHSDSSFRDSDSRTDSNKEVDAGNRMEEDHKTKVRTEMKKSDKSKSLKGHRQAKRRKTSQTQAETETQADSATKTDREKLLELAASQTTIGANEVDVPNALP
ncbi:hypothetical protein GYMLUDRAFT_52895 [Collybiopsis luxurians FD-317 M1]|nr:hypothetical protein GYMLUDRAFT_52895 [Collybiopsis luxurians FD-317 M1]